MTDLSKTQTERGEAQDDERYATGAAAGGPEQPGHHVPPGQDVAARRATLESPDEPTPHLDDSTSVGGHMDGAATDDQSRLVKEVSRLRTRWESVQIGFVDDPRRAVSDAEALVGEVINEMTAGFRHQRDQLESLWSNGQEVSTEQLRQAIQHYREFFQRFLRV